MKNKYKKNKKIMWLGFVALVVLGLIVVFHKRDNKEYDIYRVEKTQVSDKLTFAGVVDAERRVDLGFAVGGRVIKNLKKEGDFVKKGELIAEVDQSAVRAGLVQSQANYTLTQVDTDNTLKNLQESYKKLEQEQNTFVENLRQEYLSGDLQAYLVDDGDDNTTPAPKISGNYFGTEEGVYRIELYRSAAPSHYSFNLSGLENMTQTAEVFQPGELGTQGLYIQFQPNAQYNRKIFEVPVPNTRSATYLARKRAYETAVTQREKLLSDAQNKIDALIENNNNLHISARDARIYNARAQVSANAIRLSDGKITAPFDGYIVKNDLEVGETAQALIPHITLFANKKKKLVLNTPEIYINKIHEGDSVDIVLDAYPDIHFSGHITKIDDIDTLVDGVPVYETEVLFDNEDERIRVGMNAHAMVVVQEKDNVLALPQHFIHEHDNKKFVWLQKKEDEISEQEIETGLEGNDGLVEIISGLSKGQSVILRKQ